MEVPTQSPTQSETGTRQPEYRKEHAFLTDSIGKTRPVVRIASGPLVGSSALLGVKCVTPPSQLHFEEA